MNTSQTYRLAHMLGRGSYGYVYQAEEATSGRIVALKKSRASQRMKRPILQYEVRILQLLQGHPAIPAIYGYGHPPHFEYIAMELLGPSVKDCATVPVAATTVVCVVLQMLSALEHVHNLGFVHRDIKPDNMLCSLIDPSKILLIDFGLSKRIKPLPPSKYDPRKGSRIFVGTLNWASINAHNDIDLGPRDDLESLAYTGLFLLRGGLPWIISGRRRSIKYNKRRFRELKAATSGAILGAGFPSDFGHLLDYSRGLEYDQIVDYSELIRRFTELNEQAGNKGAEGPLEWSSVANGVNSSEVAQGRDDQESEDGNGDDDEDGDKDEGDDKDEEFTASYFSWDIDMWDNHCARDRDLTLPAELAELADNSIPQIIEVTKDKPM